MKKQQGSTIELQWIYGQIKPLTLKSFAETSKALRKEAIMSVEDLIKSEHYGEFFFYVNTIELNWLHELRDMAVRLSDTL